MANSGSDIIFANSLNLPMKTKAEKIALVAPQGTLVYDTTAKKMSIKTEDANIVGSWENVTSVDDA